MKLLYAVLALVIIGSATATTVYSVDYQIPSWTKNVALYWGQGELEDGEYIEFLQFLVNEEIITIPNENSDDVSQLENEVTSLEYEILSLKSSIASDLINAYDDGYAAGITSAEPVAEPEQVVSCGTGTESVNGVCEIIQTEEPEPTPTISSETRNIGAVEESGFSQSCVETGCYTPSNLSANVGDTIVMNNTDPTGVHTYTSGTVDGFTPSPDGTFDTGVLMSGESFAWTPTASGEYPYYCMLHTWMTGTITVN
jgi:plastocyanin